MPSPVPGRPSRAIRQKNLRSLIGRQRLRPAWQAIPKKRGKKRAR